MMLPRVCMRNLFVVGALALGAAPALAQLSPSATSAQIEVSAEATREVQNDLMTATMFIEASETSAAALASSLNRVTAEALKTAAEWKQVRARSGAYQTYPLYDRGNKQLGWRGRAEVRLESRDFTAMAALIGKLQPALQLGGIGFGVSPEQRRQTENELIAEAVAALRARADIARAALGAKQHRIRKLVITTPATVPPRPLLARSQAASPQAEVAAPVFEGGTSQVQVSASGTVDVE